MRGAKVLLHGTGFGKRTSSISNVTFGGWPATSFRLLDHSAGLLEATLPAGVGSVQVRVVSATGLDSGALAAPSLLYAAPSVVRCEPPALLAGPKSQSLTIFGTNLGFKVTDVDSVEVGGIPCSDVQHAAPDGTAITCRGLIAASGWADEGAGVHVTVGNQTSAPVGAEVFEAVPLPELLDASPRVVSPGTLISLQGRYFGKRHQDLAKVELGGTAGLWNCSGAQWKSDAQAACTIPADHPLWAAPEPLPGDPSETLSVRVVTTAGASSAWLLLTPGSRAKPRAPVLIPRAVDVARDLGQPHRLTVRWLYPRGAEQRLTAAAVGNIAAQGIPEAVGFEVEVAEARSEVSPLPGTERTTLFAASRVATAQPGPSDEWWDSTEFGLFEAQVPAATAFPVLVRVRACNGNGAGVWSPRSRAAPEQCTADKFLDTRGAVPTVGCRPCPAEATCAGLSDANVTARPGFWRVPWAPLGFAACRSRGACMGAEPPFAPDFRNASLAEGCLLAPREAVPGVKLDPALLEGCAPGHHGVGCSSCEPGWFATGAGACAQCGDRAVAVSMLVLCGLALFVLVAVVMAQGGLLRGPAAPGGADRAISDASLPRAPSSVRSSHQTRPVAGALGVPRPSTPQPASSTTLIKVVLSHLQAISVIGGVHLDWPPAANGCFAVADALSGFAFSSRAMACSVGPSGAIQRAQNALWGVGALALLAILLRAAFVGCRSPVSVSQAKARCRALQVPARWFHWAGPPVLVALLVMHASVSVASLRLLSCTRVGPESALAVRGADQAELEDYGQLRLLEDAQVRCDDPSSFAARIGLAVPVIVFCSVGLPVGAALATWALRNRRHAQDASAGVGVLVDGFRLDGDVYWWESAIMLRKLLLAVMIAALAASGPVAQAAGGLVAVAAALALHAWVKPYASARLNSLEAGGLTALTMTLVSSLLLATGIPGGPKEAGGGQGLTSTATVLIVGSNACFLAAAAALAWMQAGHGRQCRGERLKLTCWGSKLGLRRRVAAQTGDQPMPGTGQVLSPSATQSAAREAGGVLHNPMASSRQSSCATLAKSASWRSVNELPEESRVAFGFAPQRVEK